MTTTPGRQVALPHTPSRALPGGRSRLAAGLLLGATAWLTACGGANPLENPPMVANPGTATGKKLSFVYYQRCIQPIFTAELPINQNGVQSVNSCASSGCHSPTNGTGGAFRVSNTAGIVDLPALAATPEAVRATEMYRNFVSAQAEVVFNEPLSSRLVTKPLVRGVLHGGGLIFADAGDANVRRLLYWISRPVPEGQDEFSNAAASMFTPADPATGACNTL
jgi:hypothetical protein